MRSLLLASLALVFSSACAPIGIVQEAGVLHKGLAKGGVALTAAMPMKKAPKTPKKKAQKADSSTKTKKSAKKGSPPKKGSP